MPPGGARGRPVLAGLLRAFLRPYSRQSGLVVVLLAVQAAGNLYLPDLNADIIDHGVVDGDVGHILRAGGLMLGIVLALGAVSIATVYVAARVSMGAGADLRAAVYTRVRSFSAGEMDRFGVPSLITRNVNDVQQVQLFLMSLPVLVVAVIMSAGAVVMAVRESARLSLLLAVTVPVLALVVGVLLAVLVPLARSVQDRYDGMTLMLREQITGVRVIRAFVRTDAERDRFEEANAGMTATMLRANRIFAMTMPAVLIIANLSSVAVIWFGGRLVDGGAMPVGNLTAFLVYILQILVYALTAVTVVVLLPRAVAGAERIQEVLSTVPAVRDPARLVVPARVTGAVEFRGVAFGYPGGERPVLSDLTFELRPGRVSAIIGGTGSGKTTLINLIPRFFDATSGAVLVNGTDVREQEAEALWSAIGLVPQTSFLFGGTVAGNLRFGMPDATDERLWQALDVAQARDFVAALPGGLDAPVDQGGTNLSGGQRQRLSIARALVRRPRLYLFDDCFSALDTATDARLRAALRTETRDAAVVIAAQRVSTIMHADQIIVLDGGAVAGIGTHRRLLAGCAPYREIVASQLGAEAVR
ncbi:ABC transporter ATP-binding protein [Actinomadura verrucosospora]|uniref:ABC transporter ATP-binding protein/permease n=1 Tax=Actinomadura verrucosospora TaxID=46165 RepID=A0A7D4AKV3_ACTVE|nr:ABC transporter ATP-binding protein [Actinomadura verrucosospora]QKG19169.1 ABC transporter ATP-binding protein/permease [Actinomadura verrucosospora]